MLRVRVPGFRFQFCSQLKLSTNEKQHGMAPGLGALPTSWETRIEFLALGFSMAQPVPLQVSGEVKKMGVISVSQTNQPSKFPVNDKETKRQ